LIAVPALRPGLTHPDPAAGSDTPEAIPAVWVGGSRKGRPRPSKRPGKVPGRAGHNHL